jgi:hypothetical protein
LNGSVPFRYVPSLSTTEPIDARLGMERFADKRPADDRSATDNITDVDEKVTAKLPEDFRSSQLFAGVDFPAQPAKDELIMKGELRRFYWKLSPSPIAFIPIVNLLVYFGIPVHFMEGVAALNVQLLSPRTGQVLVEYKKSSTRENSMNIYNFKAGEAGAELADALRDVAKQIKDAVAADARAGRLTVKR